jgi:diketogulonate reductase-like aldo/keto reductase
MPYLESDEIEVQVEKSFETSKKNLHTDFIDSYILHSPVYPGSKLQRVWQKMEEFYDKKEVGALGISNCYDLDVLKYLYKNAKVRPTIVQNRFYSQSGYDKEIRIFCKQNGITYESFWSLTANPNILSSETLQNLAIKYNRGVAQIFYRFLNHIDIVPLQYFIYESDWYICCYNLNINQLDIICSSNILKSKLLCKDTFCNYIGKNKKYAN